MGLLALLGDGRRVYQRTSVMAEDLSDLEIAVLCDLLEGHGANSEIAQEDCPRAANSQETRRAGQKRPYKTPTQ